MIKVTSKYEAWKVVKGYIGDVQLDKVASENAGYSIYTNKNGEWVSDLGSRFEINLTYGGVVNVWFGDDETKLGTRSVTVYYRGQNDRVCFKKIKDAKNKAFLELNSALLHYRKDFMLQGAEEFAEILKEKFGEYEVWHYDGENEAWHDLKEEIDEALKEYRKR